MSEQDNPEIGMIGWTDLTVENADEVRDFYQAVVGWTPAPVKMGDYNDYCMNAAGDEQTVADLRFEFVGTTTVPGPNYVAERGTFSVQEGADRYVMQPEKRRYRAGGNVMTEAAIDPGFTRDVYISLGEPLGAGDWAVRVQIKPFVRWIWLGGLLRRGILRH